MKNKIDYDEISKLVHFMEEKHLTHFELEADGIRIKLCRQIEARTEPKRTADPGPTPLADSGDRSAAAESRPAEQPADSLHYVISPMVGTFYRAPDPSAPPFVDIGDEVKKNQTLCIIEAMKLMNEIESEVDGIIEEIYVENGKPVEYGQKLFAIRPIS